MHCPYCQHQDRLEIDMHADGFGGVLLECAECGALLTARGRVLETIHGPERPFVTLLRAGR